jgi:cell division protein FtsQ
MPRNTGKSRPSRLVNQQPAKVKKSGFLSRGKPRNNYRRSRSGGSPRSWWRTILCTLGLLSVAGLCLGLVLLYHQLLTSSFFCIKDIKNIEIVGARRLTPEVILHLAHLGPDTNLLALRPGRVEQALMAHPWIARAELTREWPHRIKLRIQEREPVALVQLGEELYYIDRQGGLFHPLSPGDPHNFPVITGLKPENLKHPEGSLPPLVAKTFQLLDVLKKAPASFSPKNVSEIHLDPDRGFTLYVNGLGAGLELGFDDYLEKLNKFAQVLPTMAEKGYLAKTGCIHLDYPDRVLIDLKGTDEGK